MAGVGSVVILSLTRMQVSNPAMSSEKVRGRWLPMTIGTVAEGCTLGRYVGTSCRTFSF